MFNIYFQIQVSDTFLRIGTPTAIMVVKAPLRTQIGLF